MKKLGKLLATVIILLVSTSSIFAQVSATAIIITHISISKTTDMDFGNVSGSATLGAVVLNATGSRSASGGVTLLAIAGTISTASFAVTGTGSYTFSITLSVSATTLHDDAGHTMIVDT